MENAQSLNTVGGEDLLMMHLPPQQFVVEDLLPTCIFVKNADCKTTTFIV